MILAVIDTNVLVSALWTKNDKAPTYRLLQLMQQGLFTPLYNDEILTEYVEVLGRPKFPFSKESIATIIDFMREYGIESNRIPYDAEMPDEDDRVFYEVALSKDDAYLVTGNLKHFPATTIVVTPTEMIEILFNEQ
jgi:putative PIN family toxin of toxin-antitoxin system